MTDNSPPTHRAYVVSQPREKGGKGFWHGVGVVWPHKNGNGFDVVLYEGISIHGRMVCTEPKEREAGLILHRRERGSRGANHSPGNNAIRFVPVASPLLVCRS